MVQVVAFGNPLLDITVSLPNKSLLEKYNLNEDDEKEISKTQMKSLMQDISQMKPKFSPGGAAQNTLRVLQWVLAQPHSTTMFGAVGHDIQGQTLQKLVQAAGVETRYIERKDEPTGTVIALVNGANRSLAAYIGAANYIEMDDLFSADAKNILETANVVYMEGFFLPKRQAIAKHVQQFCRDNNTIFVFNVSAVYMATNYPEDVLRFAESCDILIGNRKEYDALIKASNLTMDANAFAIKLCQDYNGTKDLKYGKMVIMTNGSKSVVCVHSGGKLEEMPVAKIDASKIGDTTGAGDAFAAGFLAGMFAGRTPAGCLKWGCWVGQQIIQQVGCTIPNYTAEFIKSIQ